MRMPQTAARSIAEALASFAVRECHAAMRALSDSKQRHRGVHEARKAIRRLKSLLILAAEPFADSLPSIEGILARLANGLSPLRDAYVAVNTARAVAGPSPSPEWQHVIEALEHRSEGRLAAVLARDPRFLKRRRELRDLIGAIEALPWQAVRRDTVEQAIAHSERRVAKAHKRASHDPSPANLHRWRRRARRLRMQLDVWRKVLKVAGKSSHHRAHEDKAAAHAMAKLSDALGAKQDLRALRAALRSLREPQAVASLLEQIRVELKKHRKVG
jgi:hypothetical protein